MGYKVWQQDVISNKQSQTGSSSASQTHPKYIALREWPYYAMYVSKYEMYNLLNKL